MRRLLIVVVMVLVAAAVMTGSASATTIQTSDASYPWQAWANASQVPTWAGTLPLTTATGYFDCGGWGEAAGCTSVTPEVDQTTGQILPGTPATVSTEIALGDPADYEEGYFYHELGQVFWSVYMTPEDEDRFMAIVDIPGDHADWDRAYTTTVNGVVIHYPPFEWFAEGYRLCATFGINQPSTTNTFSDFGYPGWKSSFAARQRQVCQLIDQVGVDNGLLTPAQVTYAKRKRAHAPARRDHRIATRGRRHVW